MSANIRNWFGFGAEGTGHGHDDGNHDHGGGGHGHTHGVIDPSLSSTDRGIWAIKWSFVILAITSAIQLFVVYATGSVALLADTIHNIGDATTAIPLWFAFVLARRKPSKTFNYGLGRVEDLAGILIVIIILISAAVAAYEAIDRLIHPQIITNLVAVGAAGIVGFIGNEAVAVFRIRVGRAMNSAALIADGYHARTDGLTSLAVVAGAVGVWLGFPLADPLIGLLITITIFGIVWQSAKAVLTRSLDGVDPSIREEIAHAAGHVAGVAEVVDTRARWLGHKLRAELTIRVDEDLSVTKAKDVASELRQSLHDHMPALDGVMIQFGPVEPSIAPGGVHAGHHHAPDPFRFSSPLATGILEIVETADGERMRLTVSPPEPGLAAVVRIKRTSGEETLELGPRNGGAELESSAAPEEPHEFDAELELVTGDRRDVLPFRMAEPASHQH
jgi:cation diffusion facilitator family transporter